jgi:hypothetical protein
MADLSGRENCILVHCTIRMHHDVSPATDAHRIFSSLTRPLIGHVPALQNDVKLDAMAVYRTLESRSTMVAV